jgi:hypothetical protein
MHRVLTTVSNLPAQTVSWPWNRLPTTTDTRAGLFLSLYIPSNLAVGGGNSTNKEHLHHYQQARSLRHLGKAWLSSPAPQPGALLPNPISQHRLALWPRPSVQDSALALPFSLDLHSSPVYQHWPGRPTSPATAMHVGSGGHGSRRELHTPRPQHPFGQAPQLSFCHNVVNTYKIVVVLMDCIVLKYGKLL